MSSRTTKLLQVRISNEASDALRSEAERNGKTIRELIEQMAIGIVEPPCRPCEFEGFGCKRLYSSMREKGYPDREVMRMIESQMDQLYCSPRYRGGKYDA